MAAKILIVGPNYQLGKCGISDYTAVLRDYFIRYQKAEVLIIALHDRYVTELETTKDFIRIPLQYSSSQRLRIFHKELQAFSPSELVFNFVSYGYQKIGLPFWLLKLSATLNSIQRLNFIVHELWIGDHKGYSWKEKALGYLQKRLILFFLGQFPAANFTTTSGYISNVLKEHRINSTPSRVFNNITAKPESGDLPKDIKVLLQDKLCINVLLFGSITRDATLEDVVSFLQLIQQQYNRKIQVVGIGGLKTSAANLWSELDALRLEGVSLHRSGYLSNEAVAWALYHGHIGISTYPIELWTKSGAIAAMLAHGLPVVVFGNTQHSGHIPEWTEYKNLYYWPSMPDGVMNQLKHFDEESRQRYNDECYNILSSSFCWFNV